MAEVNTEDIRGQGEHRGLQGHQFQDNPVPRPRESLLIQRCKYLDNVQGVLHCFVGQCLRLINCLTFY